MFTFLKKLLGFGESQVGPNTMQEDRAEFDVELFIWLKIPGNIGPMDRGEIYEDKIDPVLAERGLGSVSGGGSGLGDPLADGRRLVEYCGIDIDVTNRDEALNCLREMLPSLHIPELTELHYTVHGVKLLDRYVAGRWNLALARDFLHPGFAI